VVREEYRLAHRIDLINDGRFVRDLRILSQKPDTERISIVNASTEGIADIESSEADFGLEAVFESQYRHVTRAIATVIHDPGRAEELAVEVFLKWSRHEAAHGPHARAWLHRAAVRVALDELRRQARSNRYEWLLALFRAPPTPHEVLAAKEEQAKVRTALSAMPLRQAELLLLRSQGLDYNELAAALDLNPASVGTLLSRAQVAFRKEYVKRYGEQ
jgi:RNA polymerase sigma-70 factor (ECF subfamily)